MPIILTFLSTLSIFLLTPKASFAQCPVCIVTVGGGMLLAKKLGVDDLLVSIWISALNTAISYWAAPKIKIIFLNNPLIFSLLMFATTIGYFQFTNQLGVVSNRLFGIDKILLGMTLGLLGIIIGNSVYLWAKNKNDGKALFPYSKVVFPVGLVLVLTLVFKFSFNL